MKFTNMKIPKLGSNAKAVKPKDSNIDSNEFSEEYSKMQSQMTEATQQ